MKKLLFIALCAMFCLGSAAQNADYYEPEVDEFEEVADSTPVSPPHKYVPEYVRQEDQSVKAQLEAVSKQLNQLLLKQAEDTVTVPEDIYVPIKGKTKFTRRNHNDPDLPESTSNGKDIDEDQLDSPTGVGLNFGYSLIFVPGRIENDQLKLNRLGFAYNVGLVASFSKQEKYGTTCNFLLKSGIETGNGHAMGIGFDVLGGYGKSTGDTYLTVYNTNDTDEDDLANPFTEWCWQYGVQLWLRCNLLKTGLKNSEILAFARCVRSVQPNDIPDTYQVSDSWQFDNYWKDETWSFGIIIRYRF